MDFVSFKTKNLCSQQFFALDRILQIIVSEDYDNYGEITEEMEKHNISELSVLIGDKQTYISKTGDNYEQKEEKIE